MLYGISSKRKFVSSDVFIISILKGQEVVESHGRQCPEGTQHIEDDSKNRL